MIELHGWITIHETYKNVDEEFDNEQDIVDKITEKIASLNWQSGLLDIRACNGTHSISISIFKNHFTERVKEVFELITYIGEIAIGSYGLIYLHDDENMDDMNNEFQVFALVRGQVKMYKDNFLSPRIPTIEDE